MSLNFGNPNRFQISKGVRTSQIKNDYNRVGIFIEGFGQRLIFFLASCVPDLQFKIFLVNFELSKFKIDANGGHILFFELIISESQEDAGFPNWGMTHDYDFVVINFPQFHSIIEIIFC